MNADKEKKKTREKEKANSLGNQSESKLMTKRPDYLVLNLRLSAFKHKKAQRAGVGALETINGQLVRAGSGLEAGLELFQGGVFQLPDALGRDAVLVGQLLQRDPRIHQPAALDDVA